MPVNDRGMVFNWGGGRGGEPNQQLGIRIILAADSIKLNHRQDAKWGVRKTPRRRNMLG